MTPVRAVVDDLLARGAPFSVADVSRRAHVSRQAVHKHLRPLVESGRLSIQGKARAVRYLPVRTQVADSASEPRPRVVLALSGLSPLDVPTLRAAIDNLTASTLLIDFDGVTDAPDDVLELLRRIPSEVAVRVEPVNIVPPLWARLRRFLVP